MIHALDVCHQAQQVKQRQRETLQVRQVNQQSNGLACLPLPYLSVVAAVLPISGLAAGAALRGVKQRVGVVVALLHPHVHAVRRGEVGVAPGACHRQVLAVALAGAPVDELAAQRGVGEVRGPHSRVAGHCRHAADGWRAGTGEGGGRHGEEGVTARCRLTTASSAKHDSKQPLAQGSGEAQPGWERRRVGGSGGELAASASQQGSAEKPTMQ